MAFVLVILSSKQARDALPLLQAKTRHSCALRFAMTQRDVTQTDENICQYQKPVHCGHVRDTDAVPLFDYLGCSTTVDVGKCKTAKQQRSQSRLAVQSIRQGSATGASSFK